MAREDSDAFGGEGYCWTIFSPNSGVAFERVGSARVYLIHISKGYRENGDWKETFQSQRKMSPLDSKKKEWRNDLRVGVFHWNFWTLSITTSGEIRNSGHLFWIWLKYCIHLQRRKCYRSLTVTPCNVPWFPPGKQKIQLGELNELGVENSHFLAVRAQQIFLNFLLLLFHENMIRWVACLLCKEHGVLQWFWGEGSSL